MDRVIVQKTDRYWREEKKLLKLTYAKIKETVTWGIRNIADEESATIFTMARKFARGSRRDTYLRRRDGKKALHYICVVFLP